MSERLQVLLLRLESPLLSFGGPVIDKHGVITDFPARSMIAGLIANALGYRHEEAERLTRLQERIRFAARLDRPGDHLIDYQTVDLGQDFMISGLTCAGEVVERGGSTDKHQRFRHYRADAVVTVALRLEPEDEEPSLDEVARSLDYPARPLFIGRKNCLPSSRISRGLSLAGSLLEAITNAAPIESREKYDAQWEVDEGELADSRVEVIYDERDWENQIHCGERRVRRGRIMAVSREPES